MVEIPLAYYLGIKQKKGLDGIMLALLFSQLLLCFSYLTIIIFEDWNKCGATSIIRQMKDHTTQNAPRLSQDQNQF
jgi:Na+-driven multidrug efflux pump